MILAFREKTGCKQYVFDSGLDFFSYFSKKCYEGETFRVQLYKENILIDDFFIHQSTVQLVNKLGGNYET